MWLWASHRAQHLTQTSVSWLAQLSARAVPCAAPPNLEDFRYKVPMVGWCGFWWCACFMSTASPARVRLPSARSRFAVRIGVLRRSRERPHETTSHHAELVIRLHLKRRRFLLLELAKLGENG